VYKTTQATSAAVRAVDIYKTSQKSFDALKTSQKGLYGLTATNGFSEAITGRDMFGNKISKEQQEASMNATLGMLLPFGAKGFHGKIGIKNTGKSTKNTTTLWDIKTTADKTIKYKFNGDTVTAYRDPKTGLWWAKDTTGHGNSAFKVFKEAKGGKELHWIADSDKYGNYMINKHKSSTGTVIKIK
ncbi:T7SS effector LXG polymorphic toxin, partial [Bacillus sp. 22190]